VRYNLSTADLVNLSTGLARLGQLLFAGGARKLYPGLRAPSMLSSAHECLAFLDRPLPLSSLNLSTVHAMGTCPMGERAEVSAADSYGKVHGFENLYICDASVLPTSPGVNPQGTIMAVALRNARHFVDRGGE